MMTSKPEDRLRKNGVKTRKYYKWLRWSMKIFYTLSFSPHYVYCFNNDKNNINNQSYDIYNRIRRNKRDDTISLRVDNQ